MTRFAPLFLASLALPAMATSISAQDLPKFDESLGFDIVQATGRDMVFVNNGDHVFVCDLSEKQPSGYFVVSSCAPVIGDKAAEDLALGTASDEELAALLNAVSQRDDASFVPDIEAAFRFWGCKVNFAKDRAAFSMVMAQRVARQAGFHWDLSEDLADQIVTEIGQDVLFDMVEAGVLSLDDDTRTATLIDCQ